MTGEAGTTPRGDPPIPGAGAVARTTTVVIMGVSGSGKTTIERELARWLGWPAAEGDEFHPPANIEKMRSGHALTDADRWPWLERIACWIGERERAGESAIVTSSALRRSYRDRLRQGHPSVWFAYLMVSQRVLVDRVTHRLGHYMRASLLTSQLDALEPLGPDEPGVAIDADRPPAEVADEIIRLLPRHDRRPRG